MPLIRPEVQAAFWHWREVIFAALLAAFGLWLGTRGGLLLGTVGLLLGALGLGLGWLGWQRLRFARGPLGPGIVEVDEGQIGWYGPGVGGYVALADLAQIGLITVSGLRVWRFLQSDGQVLLIPTHAQGAGALFDALTALPGLDGAALLAALEAPEDTPTIWRKRHLVALT